jgi:hypothetical protein
MQLPARSALPLTLLLLALAAPARAQEKMPRTPNYPLQVGAAWNYKAGDNRFTVRVAKYEKVGEKASGVLAARLEVVVGKKVRAYEHVGVTPEGVVRYSVGKKVRAYEHVGVTPGGVVRYSLEGKEAKPPVLFLKLPPKEGETWRVESRVAGQLLKGAFKGGEEEVKVPAGTYKAVTVTSQDLEVNGVKTKVVCYYAEDVGLVKQVQEMAGRKVVIELEKYEPGKE